ncbi:mitochondrial assembly of ribosomal large subunit protein 1 [Drosophila teissieri]|uniref:mitochondrial assembly of ribosomal large subunit protein 1 n=1 Tax=Drosophila teissieri TaxID=7243 RepID=UPI001CBA0E0B|nr:mitochondrial assembly of ribosomal large subunit protein 1 [Drosophila teissieri]
MLTRVFRLVHDRRLSVPVLRCFHHEFTKPPQQPAKGQEIEGNPAKTLVAGVQDKYKIFRDEEATEIFDVEEARNLEQELPEEEVEPDQYYGLNLKRGVRGVFDVEDLVELLRKENVDDIFVCYVPENLKYVDHLVVCSGRSYRHMLSTAEFVRRMFKIKRTKGDILPRIEGDKSRDWMAMDLGNIALHIFSPSAREEYDLESLWAIGSQYDLESQKAHNSYDDIFMAQTPISVVENSTLKT